MHLSCGKLIRLCLVIGACYLLSSCLANRQGQSLFGSRDVEVVVQVLDKFDVPANSFTRGDPVTFKVIFTNRTSSPVILKWQGPMVMLTITEQSSFKPVFINTNPADLAVNVQQGPIEQINLPANGTYEETVIWAGNANLSLDGVFSSDPYVPANTYRFVVTGKVSAGKDPTRIILDAGYLLTGSGLVIQ